MIDERFSAQSFVDLGSNAEKAKVLSELLQQEVLVEMQQVVETKFESIVSKLNSMGHDLRLYDEKVPGDFSFRDDRESVDGYSCKLRLAIDYIISAGYADTVNIEDLDEEFQ